MFGWMGCGGWDQPGLQLVGLTHQTFRLASTFRKYVEAGLTAHVDALGAVVHGGDLPQRGTLQVT